jgi:hypothetical protein
LPNSGNDQLPEFGNRVPKFETFSSRFELPINSNARQWRIFTNMRAKMKSLKTVNLFPKIKEAFTVKLKMISIDLYFRFHQIPKNAENIL